MASSRRRGSYLEGSGRFTLDFPSTVANATSTLTVNIPGAKVGDGVIVTPDAPVAGFSYDGYVSGNTVVTVRAINGSGSTVDPASGMFTVQTLRFKN
jgi:predicted phage tail protein